MIVDYDHNRIVFPPEIYATPLRPDIVIWSVAAKKVILLEQTCPCEEGIADAQTRKLNRYQPLADDIKANTPWDVSIMAYEVGARGFVARSTFRCLCKLGLSGQERSKLCKQLGNISARCSYAIYLARIMPLGDVMSYLF